MLTENDVVAAVADHLRILGWTVTSTASTLERGDDVDAHDGSGRRLLVEAKGATSSLPSTARYGNGFDSGQVRDHVAVAVLRCLQVLSAGGALAAAAFPDTALYRRRVATVAPALRSYGIGLLWVGEDGAATLAAPWSLERG